MEFKDFINNHTLEDYNSYSWMLDGARYTIEAKQCNKDQTIYNVVFMNSALDKAIILFRYGTDPYFIETDYLSQIYRLYNIKVAEEIKTIIDELPSDYENYIKPYIIYSIYLIILDGSKNRCEGTYSVALDVIQNGFVVKNVEVFADSSKVTKLFGKDIRSKEFVRCRISEIERVCPYVPKLIEKYILGYTE